MKATRSFFTKAKLVRAKRSRPIADGPNCVALANAKNKVVGAAVAFDDAMQKYVDAVANDLSVSALVRQKLLERTNAAQERLARTVKAYKVVRRAR